MSEEIKNVYFWEPVTETVLIKSVDSIYELFDDAPDVWKKSPYVNLYCVDFSEVRPPFKYGFWNDGCIWSTVLPNNFPIEFKTRLLLLGVQL